MSRRSVTAGILAALIVTPALALPTEGARAAESYVPIAGAGSTWAHDAMDRWRVDVNEALGITANYAGIDSTAGRQEFIRGTVDFAVSELPFQATPEGGAAPEIPQSDFAYLPILAGGTSLAYNLKVDGVRVTDLRLSGEAVTRIFTGAITNWSDPAIQADNPGLTLPDRAITPVVRRDVSGSSAVFSRWMTSEHGDLWPHGETALLPVPPNGQAQSGSVGVVGYVSQAHGEGAITYVETASAIAAGLPSARLSNRAGAYVAPTAESVSIALAGATIDSQGIQQLEGVYRHADPAAYPLSSYAYMIVPTETTSTFTEATGATLAAFARYAICSGQQQAPQLGYASLPPNLVQAGLTQIARIPGASGADGCGGATSSSGNLGVTVTASGRFELTAPAGRTIDFGEVGRGRESAIQRLGGVTVIDDRDLLSGWTLQVSVDEFVADADPARTIPRGALGLAPEFVGVDAGVSLGPEQVAGAGVYPATIASGAPAAGTGLVGATLDAALTFRAPPDAAPAQYRSTVTITLVSS